MAKYLETSLAILNVVKEPRVIKSCLPIFTLPIKPNPWQPRTHFDEHELDELAQSIREHGVLQPILVSQQPDGSFQLITGERRWRAVQLAGLPTVPAMVKEATPQASLEMALVENIQRRDLNPLEEAQAFRQLIEEHGLTQEQLAQRIGKSRVAVTNTLRSGALPHTDFRSPESVLGSLNQAYQMDHHDGMYLTIWYGVYHRPTGRLRYASRGATVLPISPGGKRL